MGKMRYVYIIRCKVKFEDYNSQDYEYTFQVHSSLRKAIDLLSFYKEMYITKFNMAGYDVECDATHWVDYREDGYNSFLNIKDGIKLTTYTINRKILL